MSGFWEAPNDYAYGESTWIGSAHSVSAEKNERDIVSQLRDLVEEVTGRPIHRYERRIGFL